MHLAVVLGGNLSKSMSPVTDLLIKSGAGKVETGSIYESFLFSVSVKEGGVCSSSPKSLLIVQSSKCNLLKLAAISSL